MLNIKDIRKYIERKNSITLNPLQCIILKSIVKGEEIYTPRCIGRSILYEGYAAYLKEVVAKDINRKLDPIEYDRIFTIEDIEKYEGSFIGFDKNLIDNLKKSTPNMYEKDFNCSGYCSE